MVREPPPNGTVILHLTRGGSRTRVWFDYPHGDAGRGMRLLRVDGAR